MCTRSSGAEDSPKEGSHPLQVEEVAVGLDRFALRLGHVEPPIGLHWSQRTAVFSCALRRRDVPLEPAQAPARGHLHGNYGGV